METGSVVGLGKKKNLRRIETFRVMKSIVFRR